MGEFKTIEDLVRSIELIEDSSSYSWLKSNAPDLCNEDSTEAEDNIIAMKEMVRIACEITAGDHSTWFMLDEDGNKIHIGDRAKCHDRSKAGIVTGFVIEDDVCMVATDNWYVASKRCTLVRDSWEQLHADILDAVCNECDHANKESVVAKFIERAKNMEEE